MSNAVYVAWHTDDPHGGKWGPVGRLENTPPGYRFVYTKGARMLAGFPAFTGMPDFEEVYESVELFPLFANRLLAKSRPEYEEYLRWGGFDPNNPPDPLLVLAVTEGRRATDMLEIFPCPVPDDTGCYSNKFFAHGIRWMTPESSDRISNLASGTTLRLQPEEMNAFDAKAVSLWTIEGTESCKVGYVPRYLARDVRDVLDRCNPENIHVVVDRVNHKAPSQQRILCRMKSCWPANFKPCDREEFQPIPSNVPAMA